MNGGVGRDFEGIGGWREPSADEENEKQWLNINSRLELPALPPSHDERRRRHHRSLTSGSMASETLVFMGNGQRSRPKSAVISGDSSPEEEFGGDARTKSMLALGDAGMNIGKARSYWRRESSGSSTNSVTISTLPAKSAG